MASNSGDGKPPRPPAPPQVRGRPLRPPAPTPSRQSQWKSCEGKHGWLLEGQSYIRLNCNGFESDYTVLCAAIIKVDNG